MTKYFLSLFFTVCGIYSISQTRYPTDYFRQPINSNRLISSNFGEIRPNHFHAGLDYGTNRQIGENIYAIAEGYISRVKVSPRGYGNAVYITHPNGYVSVYAHLSKFGKKIEDYVYRTQHERQLFEIDDYLYPGTYPVEAGEIIGKSGNTGRSYAPHLHFEIRDEITEEPINPLYFGLKFPDNQPPKFEGLYLYAFAKGMENHKHISTTAFKPMNGQTISAFGTIGLGVEIHDYMMKGGARFGTYSLEMYINNVLKFAYKMERISFDESKYLNSFADFDIYRDKNKKITKCFIEPNNKLRIYKSEGSGLFDFSDGKIHTVKIIAKDITGNKSELNFKIKSDRAMAVKAPEKNKFTVMEIDCKKSCEFKTNSFKISFSEDAVYYHTDFVYTTSKQNLKYYSEFHHIHNADIPLHDLPEISIRAMNLPERHRSKALIASFRKNQSVFSAGGEWNGDFLETRIGGFGTYFITVDTVSPVIQPITLAKSEKAASGKLDFKIRDHLSGIGNYVAFIDNQWVLFEYDEKNDLISCNLSTEKIDKGQHKIVLWVFDKVGNIATFESNFSW